MTASADGTPVEDSVFFFEAGGETLFGVLIDPREPTDVGAVLLQGIGHVTATNHNRSWVRLARQLGAAGVRTVRFDNAGAGESTGVFAPVRLDRPDPAGLRTAVDILRSHGADRLVVVGACAGARLALWTAEELPGLTGLLLLAPPMADLTAAAADSFAASCRALAARGVHVLFVYGSDDPYLADFARLRDALVGPEEKATGRLDVVVLPGRQVQGLPSLAVQNDVLALALNWVARTAALPTAAGSGR